MEFLRCWFNIKKKKLEIYSLNFLLEILGDKGIITGNFNAIERTIKFSPKDNYFINNTSITKILFPFLCVQFCFFKVSDHHKAHKAQSSLISF